MNSPGEVRSPRSDATRVLILSVAERLFAEQGVFAVSNRKISEAAGLGNTTAVNYHFGTKTDLILAIAASHGARIEKQRAQLMAKVEGSTDLRDWVACMVQPSTSHLKDLGNPSWYARFNAQILTDPHLRVLVYEEGWKVSPSFQTLMAGFASVVTDYPIHVRRMRADIARHLMVHMCAERELLLSREPAPVTSTWDRFAVDLVDAIVAVWQVPPRRDGEIDGLISEPPERVGPANDATK